MDINQEQLDDVASTIVAYIQARSGLEPDDHTQVFVTIYPSYTKITYEECGTVLGSWGHTSTGNQIYQIGRAHV